MNMIFQRDLSTERKKFYSPERGKQQFSKQWPGTNLEYKTKRYIHSKNLRQGLQ